MRRCFESAVVLVFSLAASGPPGGAALASPHARTLCAFDAAPGRVGGDGCAHAPAGKAQYPKLLKRYGDARPPFDVPGVDYRVGGPAKRALADPTVPVNLPSCATYNAPTHVVAVTGNGCTLDGFDFRKGGGLQLAIPGGVSNTAVTNSLFGLAGYPAFSTSLIDNRGNGLTVTNTTSQGTGQNPMYFDTGAGGATTFAYNYFFNIDGDALDFGSTQTVIVQYNAFVKIGMDLQSHPDAVQFCGGAFNAASHESYNLLYQPATVANTGDEGIQVSVQCGGAIDGFSADHNTIIAAHPHRLTMSYSTASDGNNVTIARNYIDAKDAYGPFYPFPPGDGSATCTDNVGMTAGSEYVDGQTYCWAAASDIARDFGAFTCQ